MFTSIDGCRILANTWINESNAFKWISLIFPWFHLRRPLHTTPHHPNAPQPSHTHTHLLWNTLLIKDKKVPIFVQKYQYKLLIITFSINISLFFSYGVIQKVRSLETSSFWPPSSLVGSCSFYMYPVRGGLNVRSL